MHSYTHGLPCNATLLRSRIFCGRTRCYWMWAARPELFLGHLCVLKVSLGHAEVSCRDQAMMPKADALVSSPL